MENIKKKSNDISVYIEDQEVVANTYVMRSFTVTMLVYTVIFILNLLGIFVIDHKLMLQAYIPSMIIYFAVFFISKGIQSSNSKKKYFILFAIILIFTLMGVFLTYHAVLVALLPFLYATLYSSKRVMRYVYILTVISTIIVVYGGYYYGLCDANMVLLTTGRMLDYVSGGQFILSEINANPYTSLMLFFVIPRCFIYIAFMAICSSIYTIVSSSLERARLTAELEKAKLEAESANRAKSQFLAKMSHEIRSPINAVLGMNEMILRESKEQNIQKYAYDVKNSSVMLLNIINEILDSSKIESGMMELVPVNYEIGSLLNDLYNMISIRTTEKNLKLVFDVDPSIPKAFFGDDKRIRQVLLNLLTNAVKYTKQGTITLRVTHKVEGENAVIHYSVKDTGIGIKTEDIGKIYDAFQRFDVEKNRSIEGTGLGMNIAQQFLKLMGSELQIQSEYEEGSEFSFELVQKIVSKEPMGDFWRSRSQAAERESYRAGYIAPEAKVLVVDDNKTNRKVFRALLKQSQIQVYEAESGEECLDMLKQQSFELIFLDHMMPEMDGIETFHAIHDNKLCEGTPIIMLTANAIVGDREKYISEGFDDFLSKPIIPDKLDKIILSYLPSKFVIIEDSVEMTQQDFDEPGLSDNTEIAFEKEINNMEKQGSLLEQLRERLPEINFETGLTTCIGDEDFYLELFQDFTELPIKEELTKFLNEMDYKNYCIRIHGFKNNAYYIGAKTLGDLAYEMEKLTREELPEEINVMQKSLFEQYDRICLQYNEVAK